MTTPHRSRTVPVVATSVGAALIVGGVLAGGALLADAAAAPRPLSASQVDARVARSLVQLEIDWSGTVGVPLQDGSVSRSSEPVTVSYICTGWFADATGDIATAGHCVDPGGHGTDLVDAYLAELVKTHRYGIDQTWADQNRTWAEQHWTVQRADGSTGVDRVVSAYQSSRIPDRSLTQVTEATVTDFRKADDADVALLHVDAAHTHGLPIAAHNPRVGDAVTSIGFPMSVMEVSDRDTLEPSFKTGTISSHQNADGVGKLEMNADLSGGMSGGPTIDSAGEVVGVNSYTVEGESRDFDFISDTDSTRSFLARQMVHFAPPFVGLVDAAGAARIRSVSLLAAAAAAVLGIVAALLLGLVRRSRATDGQVPAGSPTAGPAPTATMAVGPVPWPGPAPLPKPHPTTEPVRTGSMPLVAAVQCRHGHLSPVDAVFCAGCGEALRSGAREEVTV